VKAPRAVKRWVAIDRKYSGKPNGVIRWLYEAIRPIQHMQNNKRVHKRAWKNDD